MSDFAAGHTAKRLHPAVVGMWTQGVSLVVLTVAVLGQLLATAPGAWLAWAVFAGTCGATALGCFYAALATGTMGVVAPIAGLGAVVPVVLGVLGGETPSAFTWFGMLVALIGTSLSGGPELRAGMPVRPIALAAVAALGFGGVLYGLDRGAREALAPTIWAERVTVFLVLAAVVVLRREAAAVGRHELPLLAGIGLADLAANALYAVASSSGMVSVASVLGSLYPVWTTGLAAVILHERLRRIQVMGVALTMVGVVAIGLG